jgi:3-oxocholest-4-en-26-oyl-CoA dehydrogenase alpha subunit
VEFGFTEEQNKLRDEIRQFFLKELPQDFTPNGNPNLAMDKKQQSFWRDLEKKAGEKGYLTPGWPKEYGGLGLSDIEQGIVNEERGYAGVKYWPNSVGLEICGPSLLLFGTDKQKEEHIPPLVRGEVIWFEAFTEPEAGSDEANIQLRAVENGEDFIFNGQKTFISGNFKPDFLFTEARTREITPKHKGLSLFLIPANTAGVTYRPLPTFGFGTQNEIFFDNVRVPKRYLLGEINRGFYHAMAAFEYERSNTSRAAFSIRLFKDFVTFCKETKINGKPLIDDVKVRETLAKISVELEVWRLASWHTSWRFSQREKLGQLDFDLSGYFWKTLEPKHSKMMMDILGTYGQLREGSKWAQLAGSIERKWEQTRSLHEGGTFEVIKIVLAQRSLGLPKKERPAGKS